LELLSPTVDWTFSQGSARNLRGRRFLKTDLDAVGDSLNFFDDGLG